MAKKIIIHIGPAKTGTTSLQNFLFQNRGQLQAQGCDYPEVGRHPQMPKLPGHHGIAARLRRSSEVPPAVIEQLETLPDDRTIVFSSEDFCHVEQSDVKVLFAALGGADIEVVYYARRWDNLLPSVWQEVIKHGHSRSYLEFLNAQISAPDRSRHLNYSMSLDNWSGAVGRGKIRIFSYDSIQAAGGDSVGHFCTEVLGVTLERDDTPQENKRQSVSLGETIRMLNRLALGVGTPVPRVRYALTQHHDKVKEELAALETIHHNYPGKAVCCAPELLEGFERSFLKKYGNQVENLTVDGRLFENSPLNPAAYVRPEYLFETHALELYQSILEKIGERRVEIS